MLINWIIIFLLSLFVQTVTNKTITSRKEVDCFVEHHGQKLYEGDTIEIKSKFYKVEDCALHRAYNACGPHIIYIVNIVCQAIEKTRKPFGKKRFTRFAQQKLLTEACCENLCTVSEMTRYCPH